MEQSNNSMTSVLIFYINGQKVEEKAAQPEWTLLYYLRNKMHLTGTKSGCGEGGCGACTVMISRFDRQSKTIQHYAVNACLTPLCSVHGLAITTVEGVGAQKPIQQDNPFNQQKGAASRRLHAIQERLAKAHGTQCGFCTPGFVMSMYTLLRSNDRELPSMDQVAESFQGNLCRCTGYRPIVEGLRTLTRDGCCGGQPSGGTCCMSSSTNSEELNGREKRVVSNTTTPIEFKECYSPGQEPIFPPELQLTDVYDKQFLVIKGDLDLAWYRPTCLDQLLKLKSDHPQSKMVVGNTEIGLEMKFKNSDYHTLIHPSHQIKELYSIEITRPDQALVIGGAVTLTTLQQVLKDQILKEPEHATRMFSALVEMLHWFGGKQIRNAAGLAGNIVTGSPISDLNPLLMASGCSLTLQSHSRGTRTVRMDEHFFTGYRKTAISEDEVLINITIPRTSQDEYIYGYKQSRRREDDIAIVNAGFCVLFHPETSKIRDIRLVFGGMAQTTVMAIQASKRMIGRNWEEPSLIEEVCQWLLEDLPLPASAPGGMSSYRQSLCLSFFFKFHLKVWRNLLVRGIVPDSMPDDRLIDAESEILPGQYKSAQMFELVPKDQSDLDAVGRPIHHASAEKHTTGQAIYCDDLPPLVVELYMSLVLSTEAHAEIISIDPSASLALKGVHIVLSAKDLEPEKNRFGPIIQDEEVFASKIVTSCGQVVACVIADDPILAQRASKLVKVQYRPLEPVIITLQDAIEAKSFYEGHNRMIVKGDVEETFKESENVLDGTFQMAGQEHFYLETHAVRVVPRGEDGELDITSTTQIPADLQKMVAEMLDLPYNRIVSRVKRIGGGFGGKQTRTARLVLPAALASHLLQRPVCASLDRDEDMIGTGNRHPFFAKYKVGFSSNGKLTALDIQLYCNAGHTMDSSRGVLEKAMLLLDNAYKIDHFRVRGEVCRTNLPSNTAMRGFGGPQAMLICENIVNDVASFLRIDPLIVRGLNMYRNGDRTHYNQLMEYCTLERCWTEVQALAQVNERRRAIDSFNQAHRFKKRGLAVIPSKYGLSFTAKFYNQATVLLHVYKDGSVLLTHGWTEMGQGLHTKMIQVASRALNIPASLIFISEASTDKVPNASPSGASVGSDLNGMAVLDACHILLDRLASIRKENPKGTWQEWIQQAYFQRISLSTTGFFKTPGIGYDIVTNSGGHPFRYFTFGAACSEVEIDCLTGNHRVLRTDIVMDLGESLNPAIDIGQIEGAFVQGLGLFTLEEPLFSPVNGQVMTRGPSNYKIPTMDDIPKEFNVSLLRGCPNPHAVYSSKAAGEPPLFLAASVFFAIKDAIGAARMDAGFKSGSFRLDSPASAERIRMACEDHLTNRVSKPESGTYQPWAVSM